MANMDKSALTVNPGVVQPPSVNPQAMARLRRLRRPELTLDQLEQGIAEGNITVLSQAITLLESSRPDHADQAQALISRCLPLSGRSVRIGLTGVPGAGKSTFIEAMGTAITAMGHKLAVLAIDPSSERSHGSILGDKTRMERLSSNPRAFIRPSPSAGSLGGVARKTRETIVLCEAAGFDVIFIETVGVGQSETAVHSMVDFFLLLMIAGAGDELQGIKRGIMEMADLIAINKADGDNIERANLAASQFRNALHLFPLPPSGWSPEVTTYSGYYELNIEGVWDMIDRYFAHVRANGYFDERRRQQEKYWMYETINEQLKARFYSNPEVQHLLEIKKDMVQGHIAHTKGNGYFDLRRKRQAKYWMHEAINEALRHNFYNDPRIATMLEQAEADVMGSQQSSFVAAQHLLEAYYRQANQ